LVHSTKPSKVFPDPSAMSQKFRKWKNGISEKFPISKYLTDPVKCTTLGSPSITKGRLRRKGTG